MFWRCTLTAILCFVGRHFSTESLPICPGSTPIGCRTYAFFIGPYTIILPRFLQRRPVVLLKNVKNCWIAVRCVSATLRTLRAESTIPLLPPCKSCKKKNIPKNTPLKEKKSCSLHARFSVLMVRRGSFGSASAGCKEGLSSILGSAIQGSFSLWAYKRWGNGERAQQMATDKWIEGMNVCMLYKKKNEKYTKRVASCHQTFKILGILVKS